MVSWWRSGPGPRGGREIRAAYAMLSDDLAALHGELGRSRLETVRLGAMAEALSEETGRLRAELSAARDEVATLRARATSDPLVELLARQSSELRSQLADNQRTITELTSRLTDLLEAHLEQARAPQRTRTPAPAPERPAARTGTAVDELFGAPPVADLRRPEASAAGERLRLIRRALDG